MSTNCPRCGAEMTGGVCDNCGFPLTKIKKKVFVKDARKDGQKEKKIEMS